MTKKDYRAIGQALREGKSLLQEAGENAAYCTTIFAHRIADVLAKDSPQFDRARFLRFVETGEDRNLRSEKAWRERSE